MRRIKLASLIHPLVYPVLSDVGLRPYRACSSPLHKPMRIVGAASSPSLNDADGFHRHGNAGAVVSRSGLSATNPCGADHHDLFCFVSAGNLSDGVIAIKSALENWFQG